MSKWQKLWQPTNKWLLFIPAGAFLAFFVGVVGLAGFNKVIHLSSENEFCYSCHIGMDTIVEEYQASIHFKNETGVSASCADCHVPKEFFPMMKVKITATKDIYHMLVGTINLENFEEHRLELAMGVREDMIATDSRECRNCHNPLEWDVSAQSAKAQMQHDVEFWAEKGKTCINCHHGVAHLMPLRPGTLIPKEVAVNDESGS